MQAALLDLKTCLKNINAGTPFPGRREDFDTDAAWQHWKTVETSHLQQMMLAMISFNPELAKSSPSDSYPSTGARPGSLYSVNSTKPTSRTTSISSRHSLYNHYSEDFEDDDVEAGQNFTFIPPNPRRFYKRMLELCLVADLEIMLSPEVDDNDEVSLGILSTPHLDIMNECALRWRIGHPYRAACFLDLVKQFYERNDVPIECIPEALASIQKVMQDIDLGKWSIADVRALKSRSFTSDNLCRPSISPPPTAAYLPSSCPPCTMQWMPYPILNVQTLTNIS